MQLAERLLILALEARFASLVVLEQAFHSCLVEFAYRVEGLFTMLEATVSFEGLNRVAMCHFDILRDFVSTFSS